MWRVTDLPFCFFLLLTLYTAQQLFFFLETRTLTRDSFLTCQQSLCLCYKLTGVSVFFSFCLSKDQRRDERQKPHVVKKPEEGAGGGGRAAAAADAARRGLILPPHAPGAEGGRLLRPDGGALRREEPICGQDHPVTLGRIGDGTFVGEM